MEAQLRGLRVAGKTATTGGGFLIAGSHEVGRLINFNLKITSVDCELNILLQEVYGMPYLEPTIPVLHRANVNGMEIEGRQPRSVGRTL